MPSAPSSRVLSLVGGFLAAAGLALLWLLRTDGVILEPTGPGAGPQAAALGLPGPPTLVEVGSEQRKTPKAKSAAPKKEPVERGELRAGAKAHLRERAAARIAARKRKSGAEQVERPDTVPFVVEPIFNTSAIPDFDVMARCDFHSRVGGSEPRQSGQAVFYRFQNFVADHYADPLSAPDVMTIHFDHPGAMPVEVGVARNSWLPFGEGYIVRPNLRFEPVETTLSIGLESSRIKPPFRGELHLVEVAPDGVLSILDSQPLNGRSRRERKARLRVRAGASSLLAIALPSAKELAPDLLVPFLPTRRGHHQMLTGVRTLPYPRRIARVVDPFGDPYEGLRLVGAVDRNRIAILDAATGDPVRFRGHVFIQTPGQGGASFDGTTTSASLQGAALGLMTVKQLVGGVSGSDGVIDLMPMLEGVYEFQMRTPLNGELVPATPFQLSLGSTDHRGRTVQTFTIVAPVGGIRVERPPSLGLRSNDWRHAKITLTAGGEVIPVTVDKTGIARGCVPPLVPVSVRVESGNDVFTAKVAPLGFGDRSIAVPVRVSAERSPEETTKSNAKR